MTSTVAGEKLEQIGELPSSGYDGESSTLRPQAMSYWFPLPANDEEALIARAFETYFSREEQKKWDEAVEAGIQRVLDDAEVCSMVTMRGSERAEPRHPFEDENGREKTEMVRRLVELCTPWPVEFDYRAYAQDRIADALEKTKLVISDDKFLDSVQRIGAALRELDEGIRQKHIAKLTPLFVDLYIDLLPLNLTGETRTPGESRARMRLTLKLSDILSEGTKLRRDDCDRIAGWIGVLFGFESAPDPDAKDPDETIIIRQKRRRERLKLPRDEWKRL